MVAVLGSHITELALLGSHIVSSAHYSPPLSATYCLFCYFVNDAKCAICIVNNGKAKKKCTVSQKKMTNLIILFVFMGFLVIGWGVFFALYDCGWCAHEALRCQGDAP